VVNAAASGRRGVVGAVVVVAFVVAWGVAGVRGLVVDDSRWVWGMFPYLLKVRVERVEYVDLEGHVVGQWKMSRKSRVPPALQVGRTGQTYGYGKGAWDGLVVQLGRVALKTVPAQAVAVDVVITTQRSERAPITETVRVQR
jgi:hypothetical protein